MNTSKRPPALTIVPYFERATHAVSLYLQGQADLTCNQAEANVLAFLFGKEQASLSDVHASFGHRRSTLTSILDRLEERKLVRRKRDPTDGRALILSLTAAGARHAGAAVRHLQKLESTIAKRVSNGDLQSFVKVADVLVQAAKLND